MASAQTQAHQECPEPLPPGQDPQQPRRKSMRVVLQEVVDSATGGPGWAVPGPVPAAAAAPAAVPVPGSVPASARVFTRETPGEASPADGRDSFAADLAPDQRHVAPPVPPAKQQLEDESCQARRLPDADVTREETTDRQKHEPLPGLENQPSLSDQLGRISGSSNGSTARILPSPKQPPAYAWSIDEWRGQGSRDGRASIKQEQGRTVGAAGEAASIKVDQPVLLLEREKGDAPQAVVLACPAVPERSWPQKMGPTQALMQAQTQPQPFAERQPHPKASSASEADAKPGYLPRTDQNQKAVNSVPVARAKPAQRSAPRRSPPPHSQFFAMPPAPRTQQDRLSPGPSQGTLPSPSHSPQRFLQLLLQEQHRSPSGAASSGLAADAVLASSNRQEKPSGVAGGAPSSRGHALQQGQLPAVETQQTPQRSSAAHIARDMSVLAQPGGNIVDRKPGGSTGSDPVLQVELRDGGARDHSQDTAAPRPAERDSDSQPKAAVAAAAPAASSAAHAALPAGITSNVNPEKVTVGAGEGNTTAALSDAAWKPAGQVPTAADAGDAVRAPPAAGIVDAGQPASVAVAADCGQAQPGADPGDAVQAPPGAGAADSGQAQPGADAAEAGQAPSGEGAADSGQAQSGAGEGDAGKASPGAGTGGGKGESKTKAPFGVRLRQQLGLFPDACLPVDGQFTPFSLSSDFDHPAMDRKNWVMIGGRALRARPAKPDPKAPSLGPGAGTSKPKVKQAESAGKGKGDLGRVRENGGTASDLSGDHGGKGAQAGRSGKGGAHSRSGPGAQARDRGKGSSDKAASSSGGSKQLPLQMPDWIKDTVTKWDWGPGVREHGAQGKESEPWNTPAAPHPGRVGEGGGEGGSVCMRCGASEDETTLLCDVCENSCHLRCCKKPLSAPPEGDEWLCATCAQRREDMGNAVLVETVWMPRLKEGSGAGGPSGQGSTTGKGPCAAAGRAPPGSDGLGISQGGQWLLRGDWLALGKIRIGPMFQASVPDWEPGQAWRQAGTGAKELEAEGEDVMGWVTPFGTEVAQSEAEKAEELQEELKNHEQGIWPLGWLPADQLPEGSEEERWEQCQAILVNEGDKLPDGKVARKEVQCGKWRRVPLAANLDVDKFDCSCCLPFDPYHADCAVPQEISKREIERRMKLAAEARAARKHKERERSNDRIWQEKVRELEEYKGEHGHCHMSPKSSLGLWLQTQRLLLRRGLLSRDRKAKLEEVGAALHLDDARWEENFARLLEFKKRHGHCDVLRHYAQQQHPKEHSPGWARANVETQRLIHWVRAQQQLASQPAKDKKTMKRICQLLEADFVFK